jgi:hypothetical protein
MIEQMKGELRQAAVQHEADEKVWYVPSLTTKAIAELRAELRLQGEAAQVRLGQAELAATARERDLALDAKKAVCHVRRSYPGRNAARAIGKGDHGGGPAAGELPASRADTSTP